MYVIHFTGELFIRDYASSARIRRSPNISYDTAFILNQLPSRMKIKVITDVDGNVEVYLLQYPNTNLNYLIPNL